MGSTRPNPTHVGWVDLCDGLGWVGFFLTRHGGLGQKIPSTRPDPTHAHPYKEMNKCRMAGPTYDLIS